MLRATLYLAAAVTAVGLAPPPAAAQSLADSVNARAFAAAQEGPHALRAFIHRTRMIHSLNYADYAPSVPEPEIAVDAQGDFGGATEELAGPEDGARAAEALREQIYRDMLFE